jgi:Zn-dependent protease with chaperone function
MFFLLFGLLSRFFERQADVYAARIMERELATEPAAVRVADLPDDSLVGNARTFPYERRAHSTHVGPAGASVFASALHRVAVINNIPIRARNFSHGSISQRVAYLRQLAASPTCTARFDRLMTSLFAGLAAALLVCVGWLVVMLVGG